MTRTCRWRASDATPRDGGLSIRARLAGARTGIALSLCAFAYLYVFPYQASINNPNENVRFYMTAALVDQGTYEISAQRRELGWVNDCACTSTDPETGALAPCTAPRDPARERYYSVKAPGTSLLGVLPYAAYQAIRRAASLEFDRTVALAVCRLFGAILPWLIFLFYFARFLARHAPSRLIADAVFISVALGSCLYGYGMLFMSHSLSAAAAFGAFMLLYDARREARCRTLFRAAFAGFLAASVSLLEYPGFVASLFLSLYALIALRSVGGVIAYGLGALIPTGLMMHFQHACFGSALSPGHLFVENQAFREQHEEGFFGAVGFQWDAVYGLLFHPGAGLFPLTPTLIFGVLGLGILAWRRGTRVEGIVSVLLITLTVVSIAFMNNWRGGWTIGPRYLALVYPFLGWAAVIGLGPLVRRWPRFTSGLALGTTAVSLLLSAVPSAYYPHYPPEIDRPFTQLAWVLIEHDYAPYTWLEWYNVHGTLSMIPWFVAATLTLVFIASAARGLVQPHIVLLIGALVAGVVATPLVIDPRPEAGEVDRAVAHVTRGWQPQGHDRAAVLELTLTQSQRADGYRELASIYETEGRVREAARARHRAEMLEVHP